jgi:hypothetical protein
MDSSVDIFFYFREDRTPYIEELIDYQISNTEGCIHFDGYYYVQDDELPRRLFFSTTVYEKEPYEIINGINKFRILENEKYYEVEVIDRTKIYNTSEYSEVCEEDGSVMRVCFFPTHEQKISFKIINIFNTDKDITQRINEFKSEKKLNKK